LGHGDPTTLRSPALVAGHGESSSSSPQLCVCASHLFCTDTHNYENMKSASAVYTMHGGTILSHKNFKWSCASAISFLVSLYALTLRTESKFVDGERAYELKATLNLKHRAAEIIWGGILLLFLGLTVKEKIDNAIESTASAVKNISSSMGGSGKQKKT